MHQIETLKESFLYIKKNPWLYAPDLILAALTSILLYFIYQYTGAANFITSLQSNPLSIDLFTSYLSANLKEIILSAIMFFFFSFIFGVGIIVTKFIMIRQIISGKKISLANIWKEKKGYFWSIVFLRIIVYILSLLAISLVALIALALYFLLFSFNENFAIIFSLAIAIPLAIILFIAIKLALLFRYPIMFLRQIKKPVLVLKESYSFLRNSPEFVISTWFIVILLSVIFWTGTYILETFVDLGISFIPLATTAFILSSLWSLIGTLLTITIDLWASMYVFLQFKRKDLKH